MTRTSVLLSISVFLPTCIDESHVADNYTLSFSLEVGTKWTYESTWLLDDSLAAYSIVSTVVTSQETGPLGQSIFELTDSQGTSTWKDYYEYRNDGIYLFASEPGGIHALWKAAVDPLASLMVPPKLLVPFSFVEGQHWVYDTLLNTEGSKVPLKRAFLGLEEVNTPLGSLHCYKFRTAGYIGEARYHYYADGVGLVAKEEVIDNYEVATVDTIGSSIVIVSRFYRSSKRNVLLSRE